MSHFKEQRSLVRRLKWRNLPRLRLGDRKRGRSRHFAVARVYLQQKHARLALPEVVRLEVEHNLRNRLRDYVATLQSTHRQLLTVFGTLKELVVPDATAIEGRVTELFGNLGVEVLEIPFSLPSAKSSFLKAIDKLPPSDRTQEFKDGVLWADCAGLLKNDDVCLITADKAFFQERDYTKGLSKNLAAEIADAVHAFSLLPSLDQLVRDLRIEVAIDENVLVRAYLDKSFEAIDGLLKRNGFVLGEKLGWFLRYGAPRSRQPSESGRDSSLSAVEW